MVYSQTFQPREEPLEMAGIECGELFEGRGGGSLVTGKLGRKNGNGTDVALFGHYCLQSTEYQYVGTLIKSENFFFIMI